MREHQPGESLRGVHWPATAHHGRLMVKELDDPGGDELAIVLDARASGEVGSAPDSSFELAVAAASTLVERAHADSRRVRLVVAGGEGEPATASERMAARRLLARARASGERSPRELVARLAAERVEVITTTPGAFVGAGRGSRIGVIAIDPSGFDPSRPRDAAALSALRAAGSRVVELRRPERGRAPCRGRVAEASSLRGALLALAAAYGLLHARDLQSPALSTPRLLALAALAVAPALIALRAGRRLALLALAVATLAAAWTAAGHRPSPGAPLAGLAGRLADAPSAWVEVVLPFDDGHPELRAAVLIAVFAWIAALAWLWLVRPRPLAAGLLATLPFAVSATVYDLPGDPWRALAAAALLLAFLRSGRPAGGGPAVAVGCAAVALALGAGWSAVPATRGRRSCPGRRGRSRSTATTRRRSRSSGTCAISRCLPAAAGGGAADPLATTLLLAHRRARRVRRPALQPQDGPAGRSAQRWRNGARPVLPQAGRLRAEVAVTTLVDSFLVAPGQPASYTLPRSAGAVEIAPDGSAELLAPPAGGLAYTVVGSERNPPASALRALPAAIRRRSGMTSRSPAPSFRPSARRRARRRSRGSSARTAATRLAGVGDGVRQGAQRHARRRLAVPGHGRARGLAADDARLRRPGEPAPRPDALARWSATGTAGYCQMFAASLAALARLSACPPGSSRASRPDAARRRLPRDRSRRARLGGGVVPGLRLAAVRRHAGPLAARARVVVLGRRSTARRRRRGRPRRRRHRPAAAGAAARAAARDRRAAAFGTRRGRGLVAGRRVALACSRCSPPALLAKRALLRLCGPPTPRAQRADACVLCGRSGPRAEPGAHAARARSDCWSAASASTRKLRDRARACGLRSARASERCRAPAETGGCSRAARRARPARRLRGALSLRALSAARGRAR